MDLFALSLPMRFDGIRITPWAMMAGIGPNVMALTSANDPLTGVPRLGTNPAVINSQAGQTWGQLTSGMLPAAISTNDQRLRNDSYSTGVWAGLTGELTMLDPWRFAWDVNYGSVTGDKGYLNRSGWMVNALLEYKMDWATPGIYGWYSTGDDSNPHNGSERMPSISACGNFMSFMGDGNLAWGTGYNFYDNNLTYAGTWGVGLQIADVSFVEDLKHTFRVAYWGGTNSPSMAKYVNSSYGWQNFNNALNFGEKDGPYLTTNDGLLEFNLVNSYQIYENLEANLELGYIVNMMDDDTWKRSYRNDSYKKQDAWKAQLIFAYSF